MPSPSNHSRVFLFGLFELDGNTGDLRKDGKARPRLQGQPLEVLLELLDRNGEVVSREEFRQRLWPADTFVDYDHSLNTAVNKAREALGDSADNPRFIQTIPRRGYRFLAPVEIVDEKTVVAKPAEKLAVETKSPQPRKHRPGMLSDPQDLPTTSGVVVRILFSLIQVMYLCFYVLTLAQVHRVQELLGLITQDPGLPWVLLIVSALIGIPVRLYLLSAAVFGYKGLAAKFLKLFPFLVFMDEVWALAPFLLTNQIGVGLAMAAAAALLYVPFAQRSLLLMGAGKPKPAGSLMTIASQQLVHVSHLE